MKKKSTIDKFTTKRFDEICELVDELQICFIEDDSYSRTPSASEWRRAKRKVHKLVLCCYELAGYTCALKTYQHEEFQSQLKIVKNSKGRIYK